MTEEEKKSQSINFAKKTPAHFLLTELQNQWCSTLFLFSSFLLSLIQMNLQGLNNLMYLRSEAIKMSPSS